MTSERTGDEGEVETPVPIPNTEVKHFSGDNSWPCACEDSTLPGFDPYLRVFFSWLMIYTVIINRIYLLSDK